MCHAWVFACSGYQATGSLMPTSGIRTWNRRSLLKPKAQYGSTPIRNPLNECVGELHYDVWHWGLIIMLHTYTQVPKCSWQWVGCPCAPAAVACISCGCTTSHCMAGKLVGGNWGYVEFVIMPHHYLPLWQGTNSQLPQFAFSLFICNASQWMLV